MSSERIDQVLAIDTSTRNLVVGLQFGGDRLVQSREAGVQSHGQLVMKKIDHLLESARLRPENLEAMVVGVGPGSFTGLRIGLAAAKGMATALGLAVVDVGTFEIAAHRLRGVETPVVVVVPLNRDEAVVCPVEAGECEREQVTVVRYTDFPEFAGPRQVAGIGLDLRRRYPELPNDDLTDQLDFDGSDLLAIGGRKLARGYRADIATLEPFYVRKSQAEIRFDQQR